MEKEKYKKEKTPNIMYALLTGIVAMVLHFLFFVQALIYMDAKDIFFAKFLPMAFLLGVLFYLSFFFNRGLKIASWVVLSLFIVCMSLIANSDRLYSAYVAYKSKANMPKELKDYVYLAKDSLSKAGGKEVVPLEIAGKYELEDYFLTENNDLLLLYDVGWGFDSSLPVYLLKYNSEGAKIDSLPLGKKETRYDQEIYYAKGYLIDTLHKRYFSFPTDGDKKPKIWEASAWEKHLFKAEKHPSINLFNVMKKKFQNAEESFTRRALVPRYYLEEHTPNQGVIPDYQRPEFYIFESSGKLYWDLHLKDTILHLCADFATEERAETDLYTPTAYISDGNEAVEKYKNLILYSNKNLKYHLLYMNDKLYMVR